MEAAPRHEFHGHQQTAIIEDFEIEYIDDVGRSDPRARASLAAEFFDGLAILGERRDDLDRGPTLDLDVAGLVDHAHAALAEPANDSPARAWNDLSRCETQASLEPKAAIRARLRLILRWDHRANGAYGIR